MNNSVINMTRPSCDEIEQLSKEYGIIPVCKEIYADFITPITLLRKLSAYSKNFFLLESVEGGESWGRYSFLGYQPLLRIYCKNGHITVEDDDKKTFPIHDPYEFLRNLLRQYRSPKLPDMPPFAGGLVGYFSYGMITYDISNLKLKNSVYNDFDLMLFDKVIAFDHLKQKLYIIVNMKTDKVMENYGIALATIEKIKNLIQNPMPVIPNRHAFGKTEFKCNVSKEKFIHMVEKAKKYISEGEIFQTVISRRFEAEYTESLINAYRVLRTTNPSPYMVFLQNEELQIISTSPETMVRLRDGLLTTVPIGGLRPRGKDASEDKALARELLNDEKELSEHAMLIDLARNDLGKVSEISSIHISDYMKLHRYSKIMHITTEVQGRIRNDKDALDAIKAILPAGTLSGAPKIRACEIIEEIEKEPRGIYGGAIGYLDFSGNMDTCIAIRMAVKRKNRVYIQAGCGIVIDSDPEKEYEETNNKALAMIEAIERAREVEE